MKPPADIDVDLEGLRTFGQSLRDDIELGLKPGMNRAEQEIQQGIRFGLAAPGGQLAASREVFAAALQRAAINTARQVHGAQILSDAINQVLATYADADADAATRVAQAEHRLSSAMAVAKLSTAAEHTPLDKGTGS